MRGCLHQNRKNLATSQESPVFGTGTSNWITGESRGVFCCYLRTPASCAAETGRHAVNEVEGWYPLCDGKQLSMVHCLYVPHSLGAQVEIPDVSLSEMLRIHN